jgi:hypothetical protein
MLKIYLFGNKLQLYLLVLSNFLVILTAQSQNYVWPTSASKFLTSSFCEFRPRHYHAAIDIKTWNRTGYRIFAIDDGYIMRVRVSAFGYGKAIYIKLKDGNIAVYAHLKKFSPELESYVNSARRRNQKYRLDLHLTPEKFPVTKGQLIAYSGKTGIGYPHLHFEIRNPQNQPMNPLQFYQTEIQDNYAPQLYEVALFPVDHTSLINQRSDTLIIDLQRSNTFTVNDTLLLSGKVALALKSYDFAEGARNRFSFYRAKMWIDDSLVYSVQYDQFSYAHTKKVEIDKNYSLWRKGAGIFHNLYRHPANNLSHYAETPRNGGIIDTDILQFGIHHLQIDIEDFANNLSTVHMPFRAGESPLLAYDLKRLLDEELFLRIQSPLELTQIDVFKRGNPGEWNQISLIQDYVKLELDGVYHYTFSIPALDSISDTSLKISGITIEGTPSFPLYLTKNPLAKPSDGQSIFKIHTVKYKKDWLELITKIHFHKPTKLLNELNKKIPELFWFPMGAEQFEIHIPVSVIQDHDEIFSLILPGDYVKSTLVRNDNKYRFSSEDQLFEAYFPISALYDWSSVRISEIYHQKEIHPLPPEAGLIGQIYDLQPFDEAVDAGVKISLSAPEEHLESKGIGLYYWDPKKGWLFIPSNIDSIQMRYQAGVTSLEKFILLQDTVPPLLYPVLSSRQGVIQSQDNKIRFTVKDELSGIQKESQIRVSLNGEWQLFEYDPEEDYITIYLSDSTSEVQQLMLSVTDNVGNQSIKEYKVR